MKLQELNEELNVLFVEVSFNQLPSGDGAHSSQIVGPFANKAERDKFIDIVGNLNDGAHDDDYDWYPIEHIDPYNPKKQFMSSKEFIDDFHDRYNYGDDFNE